ncbi:glutamate mutase L [bacterium]|nr:glutamate mutase L [bacterium]
METKDFEKGPFLITDVGSTTTKAFLFEPGKKWGYYREEGPTTVEKPYEDVTIGVLNAVWELEKTTGRKLLENGKLCIPYLSTSSAGGGLAMVVAGLIRQITTKSAERVALGAGAILLDIIALDDGRTPYKKIEALKNVRPDMLLLSGGFDHGSLSGPVFIAEIISQAELHPKLSKQAKLDLIFAGNVDAREWVEKTMTGNFVIHHVPNIRPEGDRENLEPARDRIHELFTQHVMSHAPGYEKLKRWVSAPILPTPAAFSKLLASISEDLDKRILAIDIGGATTDIFTAEGGDVFRTVSANLGMSYSIMNVIRSSGLSTINKMLQADISDTDLLDKIGNKHINPTSLPEKVEDAQIEQAVATVAIREALKEHLSVLKGLSFSLGQEELNLGNLKPQELKWLDSEEFQLEGYDVIIGSGGILSHSPREIAAEILLNGLQPRNVVSLAVDSSFMFPQLGVLSQVAPELAKELFYEIGYIKLATAVSPVTGDKPGNKILTIREINDNKRAEDIDLNAGEVRMVPVGKDAKFSVRSGELNNKTHEIHAESSLFGLILDGRIRPINKKPHLFENVEYDLKKRKIEAMSETSLYRGDIEIKRELAIPGEVYVKAGQEVSSDTVVAKCVKAFLRPFFLDIASVLNISPEKLKEVLSKKIGDDVHSGEVIAQTSGILGKKFRSPVSGTVEKILPDGSIVVREKPEYAKEVYIIDVARELSVKPFEIKPYLKVQVGQEVGKTQHVAAKMTVNEMKFARSPMRGIVTDIKTEEGLVVIEPLLEELELFAWLPGKVSEVFPGGCSIRNRGTIIQGTWGLGGEAYGNLKFSKPEPNCIFVSERVDSDLLDSLKRERVSGLITAGVHLAHFWKDEPEFTVVLLKGFGDKSFDTETIEILRAKENCLALLDGTTQLRVGVKRPKIIIPG